MEVIGQKAHGAVPEPGSVVIARVSDRIGYSYMIVSEIACLKPCSYAAGN